MTNPRSRLRRPPHNSTPYCYSQTPAPLPRHILNVKSPGEYRTHMPEDPILPAAGRRQVARAAALGAAWLAMRQPSAAAASASGTLLDAREFGARGDGKADDTRSLQSTIDAAAARGGAVF